MTLRRSTRSHHPASFALATFLAAVVVLAFTAAAASASRPYESQLTEANGVALANPMGLAVDGSDNLWVTEATGGGTVDKFNSAGAYEAQTASPPWSGTYIESAAFSASAGEVFVSDSNADDLWGLEPSAAYSGTDLNSGLGGGCCYIRVAADNSGSVAAGDLYVSTGSSVIRIDGSGAAADFTSSEPYVSGNELTGPFSSAGALAVDFHGDLYVAAGSKVYIFEPSGDLGGEITEFEGSPLGSINAIAVDPGNENILVAESGAIEEFSASGESLAKITGANGAAFGNIQGLAVDSTGTLYAADGADHVVDVFGAVPSGTAKEFPLEVTVSGNGSVGSSPSGIACGSGTCTHEFKEGKTVTLTAHPDIHNKFEAWSGCDAEPSPTTCEVTIDEARAVEAEFAAIPPQILEVAVAGEGEVTSSPAGIACTAATSPCSEGFDSEGPEGTVTLTASPDPYNHFVEWSGADAGSCSSLTAPSCELSMNAARSISAEFAPSLHTLAVTPSGPGLVDAAAGAISGCEAGGGTCAGPYQEGSTVPLIASPATHHHVTWGTGECKAEPSADECEVEIGASDGSVQAAFSINTHILTVDHTGLGSVSANQGAISGCSAAAGACSGLYDETSTIILTATPAAHKHTEWVGGCSAEPSPDECKVEIGPSDQSVEVSFPPNQHFVTVAPTGEGTVRANSGAISHCTASGGSCAGEYIEAGTVTLIATPGAHRAVMWSGCTRESGDRCEMTVGPSSAEVGAAFSQITHSLTITKSGMGQGSVSCDGGACAPSYDEGTVLTLAASADSNSSFVGWSGGGCAGTGACQMTIEADTSINAGFDARPAPPPAEEQECVVPRLVGKTPHGAKSMLRAADCSLGKVTKPKSRSGHGSGRLFVRSSSPKAGATLPAGAQVDLRLTGRHKHEGRGRK
jgi:hypothetical protein